MAPSFRHPYAWPLIAIAVSALMLAAAHAFQAMGYAPCTLCLRQREVYWGALAAGLAGLVFIRFGRLRPEALALMLAAVFLTGAVVASYHAGAEWKWWPGPTSCSSGGAANISTSAITDLLNGAKVHAPACDQAAWRMLGISMAGYNALISLALAALGLAVAFRRPS